MKRKKIAIAGAGLVGSLLSVILAKRGHHVDIYERRTDFRKHGFKGGRSINLALSNRGWKALSLAGVDERIRSVGLPMKGRMMHDRDGELTYQPYGLEGQAIYSVSRADLNIELLKEAEQLPNVQCNFDQKIQGLDLEGNRLILEDGKMSDPYDLIIGTDGANSAIRNTLEAKGLLGCRKEELEAGYKELSIDPFPDGTHRLSPEHLHIWPRRKFMMIALPNMDGSFTVTMFMPHEGQYSFESIDSDDAVLSFFESHFRDSIPLMPDLINIYNTNKVSNLTTIRTDKWVYKEKVLLLGDAAHAIVPFYGQGMNSGFEDCSILSEMLDRYDEDWKYVLKTFNETRIKDGNAIADLALYNFIEMRDKVADEKFLWRKAMEKELQLKYPDKYLPLYSLVTFSHTPYSEALAEGRRQDRIFEDLLNHHENPQLVDVEKALGLI